MPNNNKLIEQIESLPPQLQDKIADYIEFLLKKHSKCNPHKFTLSWKGKLSHLKDKFNSVELQKKALEWRISHAAD